MSKTQEKLWPAYYGTNGDDNIEYDGKSLFVYGEKGNDKIDWSESESSKWGASLYGHSGNDTIIGTKAADEIFGGSGDDEIHGGEGKDIIKAGKGNDLVYGDAGNDKIYGVYGNNKLYGGDGDDKIFDGKGKDEIYGDAGNDKIYLKKSGHNTVSTGAGKDIVYCNTKNNTINLGSGKNTIVLNNTKKTTILQSTGENDKIVIKLKAGCGIKYAKFKDSDLILSFTASQKNHKVINKVIIKDYTEDEFHKLIVMAGKEKIFPDEPVYTTKETNAKTTSDSYMTSNDINAAKQELVAWQTLNKNSDMQALIDTADANKLPDVTAYFVQDSKVVG